MGIIPMKAQTVRSFPGFEHAVADAAISSLWVLPFGMASKFERRELKFALRLDSGIVLSYARRWNLRHVEIGIGAGVRVVATTRFLYNDQTRAGIDLSLARRWTLRHVEIRIGVHVRVVTMRTLHHSGLNARAAFSRWLLERIAGHDKIVQRRQLQHIRFATRHDH